MAALNFTVRDDRLVAAPAMTVAATTAVERRTVTVRFSYEIHGLSCAEVENLGDNDFRFDDIPGSEVQLRDESDHVLAYAAVPTAGEDDGDACVFAAEFGQVRASEMYQIGNNFRGWFTWDENDVSRDVLDAGITIQGR
jgi:hypothetical protein